MVRRSRRRSPSGSIRLFALLLALVGLNVYVFVFRHGTSLRDVLKMNSVATPTPSPESKSASEAPVLEDKDERSESGFTSEHDTLSSILLQKGLRPSDVDAVVHALKGLW